MKCGPCYNTSIIIPMRKGLHPSLPSTSTASLWGASLIIRYHPYHRKILRREFDDIYHPLIFHSATRKQQESCLNQWTKRSLRYSNYFRGAVAKSIAENKETNNNFTATQLTINLWLIQANGKQEIQLHHYNYPVSFNPQKRWIDRTIRLRTH